MNVKDYEKIIRPRLKDARFEHSKNVSKEAVRLAKKYGADVEKAAIAGILHDITNETSEEEQLEIMKKAGIELSPLRQTQQSFGTQFQEVDISKSFLGLMMKIFSMLFVIIQLQEVECHCLKR